MSDPRAALWTLAAYVSYARYYVETFRAQHAVARVLDGIEATGYEAFLEAAERGEGSIVALAHVGNWDIAGAWASAVGAPVTAVAERLPEESVTTFFDQLRDALGIRVVPTGVHGTRALLRTLHHGGRVALVVDRDVTGSGRAGRLFGRDVSVAAGPAVLSVLSGVPIYPAACYQLPGRRHLIRIWPPLTAPSEGSREARIDELHRRVVRALELQIAAAPSQWHNLAPDVRVTAT